MSVIGIDLGTESCVIAAAHRGQVDIVVNEVSHRKTPSIVAFGDANRNIGESGLSSQSSNIKRTITEIKRFIGRSWSEPSVQQDLQRVQCKSSQGKNDEILFEVATRAGTLALTPLQVLGALLGKLRTTVSYAVQGQRVSDCVISCPPYYTNRQRIAIIDAGRIAGLNVLRVMNETTAVALNYGILRTLPPKEPINVAFVDVGHSATNMALVSFVEGKLDVLATSSAQSLGGRDFDEVLVAHLAEAIRGKYKLDVMSRAKAQLRLRKACQKMKLVLSANKQAPLHIECLMDDIDVNLMVDRADFEKLSASLCERFREPMQQVFDKAKLQLSDVHSVEIIGGGVRVPAVRELLKATFDKDLSQTCNGDESVARGCALQCAMISPAFRVREFQVHDVTPYAIEVCWGPVNDDFARPDCAFEEKCEIFSRSNSIPCVKLISFIKTEPFQIVLRYLNPGELPAGSPAFINRVVITPPPASEDLEKPAKIKVKIAINVHGIVHVKSAILYEELKPDPVVEEPETAADESKTDAAAEPAAADASTADASTESIDVEPTATNAAAAETMEDATTPSDDLNKSSGSKSPDSKKKKEKKKPKKTLKTDFALTTMQEGALDEADFKSMFEKEVSMSDQDRVVAETSQKRNDLESYVYEMRDKLGYDLKEYISEDARQTFSGTLSATEDWLYTDEGHESQKSEYAKRSKKLHSTGDPIMRRQWEHQHRDEAIGALKATVVKYQMFLQSVAGGDKQYKHIEADDIAAVRKQVDEVGAWLVEQLQKQDKISMSDDPAFTVKQCREKQDATDMTCLPIMNKPKPKVEPKPEQKDAAAADAQTDGTPNDGATATANTDDATKPSDDAGAAPDATTAASASASNVDMDVD